MGITPTSEDEDKSWLGEAMANQLALAIEDTYSDDSERRKRHAALMDKWPVLGF